LRLDGKENVLTTEIIELDVPPVLSSTAIWSPIPQTKEIGCEEAFFRRANHWLST
jgi:hypothetical protein